MNSQFHDPYLWPQDARQYDFNYQSNHPRRSQQSPSRFPQSYHPNGYGTSDGFQPQPQGYSATPQFPSPQNQFSGTSLQPPAPLNRLLQQNQYNRWPPLPPQRWESLGGQMPIRDIVQTQHQMSWHQWHQQNRHRYQHLENIQRGVQNNTQRNQSPTIQVTATIIRPANTQSSQNNPQTATATTTTATTSAPRRPLPPTPVDPGTGYDDDIFVDTPPEEFSCPICLLVMRNPFQSLCGHHICQGCAIRCDFILKYNFM